MELPDFPEEMEYSPRGDLLTDYRRDCELSASCLLRDHCTMFRGWAYAHNVAVQELTDDFFLILCPIEQEFYLPDDIAPEDVSDFTSSHCYRGTPRPDRKDVQS